MSNDNTCGKNYPKEYCEVTVVNENGYPTYRRRSESPTVTKGVHLITARDVVPYNPYLSKKYQCHLNVEFCGTIRAVKYLYKYTYKGHDRAALEFEMDEVKRYIDARYVGPPEGVWRIFGFHMHDKSHAIERLAVHLPFRQRITFSTGEERAALEKAEATQTTLTAWFALNAESDEWHHLQYGQIPEHFTWQRQKGIWQYRIQKGPAQRVIGRLYGAQPTEGERFFLYLLLLHVPGAQGFLHLKTFGEKTFDTFREAAVARGLVESDKEYEYALEEAAQCQTPKQMRMLFAHILLNCDISEPARFWEQFRDAVSEDFFHRTKNADDSYNLALSDLQKVLGRLGKQLEDFGLPCPHSVLRSVLNKDLERERDYDRAQEQALALEKRSKMYSGQALAYDTILDHVTNEQHACFYVDGPGGCGKTFLYEALLHHVRGQNKIALACAWSGIAATLLVGGRTCHSRFGLPVPMPRDNVPSTITAQSSRAEVLRQASLIVWDEAPMAPTEALDAVDRLLRDFMDNDLPFGGKILVLGGDFRQVLPVMPHCTRDDIVSHIIKVSDGHAKGTKRDRPVDFFV